MKILKLVVYDLLGSAAIGFTVGSVAVGHMPEGLPPFAELLYVYGAVLIALMLTGHHLKLGGR